ncbi:MAG: hypothetical protein JSW41_03780 [Candidatus Aenigmatarchaeota archaeon]|nr:MAG: hypothetical protein JSW41_03780 [Candidatus Aenigmarchaeota archaeon]
MSESVGKWAFILGVVIAVIAGLVGGWVTGYNPWILLVLVILGLVVGFLNISAKEVNVFLLSAIALILVGTIAQLTSIDTIIPLLGSVLQAMVNNIAAFVAPAALIVSLKAVYNLAARPTV